MKKNKLVLSCVFCQKPLLEYLIPEDNDENEATLKICAQCPYCNMMSKVRDIYRHLSVAPVPNTFIQDSHLNSNGITIFTIGIMK